MLLTLPLEIWEIVFGLLNGEDLQLMSKVPGLRGILATARRSTHRLEAYRAVVIDVSLPGSRSLAERVELLKAYRARWENLRWTEVTSLPPRPLWIYHFSRNVMASIAKSGAPIVQCLRLPFCGIPVSLWEGCRLGWEHGVKTFSAYPEKNLLVVLEEWLDGIVHIRLHVGRLDTTRDIMMLRDEQWIVCQPFMTEIDLGVDAQPGQLSCEIEQVGHRIGVLFAFYVQAGYCANFFMWDVTTQEQVVNISSLEYRSFVFLDHRWVLFGAVCSDLLQDTDHPHRPYLEIVDPINPTYTTRLELDKSAMKRARVYSTVDISVGSGAGSEGSFLEHNGAPFTSDVSRGIISADLYCYHPDANEDPDTPWYESYVFILKIEDILRRVPSLSNPEQRFLEWKDLSPSGTMFYYASANAADQYRIFSRHSYVSGSRYVSPIRPLDSQNPMGPRCFFVYDFNPYRETPVPLSGAGLEDPDPETGYSKCASEITREVVGGLRCWRMRFDLPAAGEGVGKCNVALTDGGIILFELDNSRKEIITVFSMW